SVVHRLVEGEAQRGIEVPRGGALAAALPGGVGRSELGGDRGEELSERGCPTLPELVQDYSVLGPELSALPAESAQCGAPGTARGGVGAEETQSAVADRVDELIGAGQCRQRDHLERARERVSGTGDRAGWRGPPPH